VSGGTRLARELLKGALHPGAKCCGALDPDRVQWVGMTDGDSGQGGTLGLAGRRHGEGPGAIEQPATTLLPDGAEPIRTGRTGV
jgi:hypothetical protein